MPVGLARVISFHWFNHRTGSPRPSLCFFSSFLFISCLPTAVFNHFHLHATRPRPRPVLCSLSLLSLYRKLPTSSFVFFPSSCAQPFIHAYGTANRGDITSRGGRAGQGRAGRCKLARVCALRLVGPSYPAAAATIHPQFSSLQTDSQWAASPSNSPHSFFISPTAGPIFFPRRLHARTAQLRRQHFTATGHTNTDAALSSGAEGSNRTIGTTRFSGLPVQQQDDDTTTTRHYHHYCNHHGLPHHRRRGRTRPDRKRLETAGRADIDTFISSLAASQQ